ncbi:MAG TPA: hypothetical protein VKB19_03740 [Pedobacter sp.]|nr:hypothetical protein [Pedobacter sp.]
MGAAAGGGAGIIILGMVAFTMGVVIYSPLIAVTFGLLYPMLLLETPSANFGLFEIIYIVLFLTILYLLSCAFEYFRARMLEARRKNLNWKIYFTLLFFVRIIIPVLAVHFYFYFQEIDGYSDKNPFTYPGALSSFFVSLIVFAMLLWKVKILNADNRYFFTKWAFNRGITSMVTREENEETLILTSDTTQLQIFYTIWGVLTLLGGLLFNYILKELYPGPLFDFNFTVALIFSFSFVIAAWLAKIITDRASIIYLKYNFREKMSIQTISLILVSFYPTLIMWPGYSRFHFSHLTIILLYIIIMSFLIGWKIRKYQQKSQITES